MPKEPIFKIANAIAILPLMLASKFLLHTKTKWITNDLSACMKKIEAAPNIPDAFIEILYAAEDHRNKIHQGVDALSIIRIISKWLLTGKKTGGGSTIEQQFVRTVTKKYKKSIKRKIGEQLTAIALCDRCEKRKIAAAYLSIAYFGSNNIGIEAIKRECGTEISTASTESILSVIAKLKYPEPHKKSHAWTKKIHARKKYILNRSKIKEKSKNIAPLKLDQPG